MTENFVQTEVRKEDLDALLSELKGFTETVRKKVVVESMMAGGNVHLSATKRLVPRGRTGNLRASLMITKLGKQGDSVGGARVLARRSSQTKGGYYAHLVERGHRIFLIIRGRKRVYIGHWPGRPFMRPALEQNKQPILSEIVKTAQAGIAVQAAKMARKMARAAARGK
ncbi:MAG: hypothetical protein E6R03_00730 [Hyphomicrobiaceae bacterium]|nr:MAG: hypothetical protein E6R03_00730 [Hyphomicrobiaceae bacterium]